MYPGTVRQTQWLDPFNRDRRCDRRWLREEDMLKREDELDPKSNDKCSNTFRSFLMMN
ncbi:unnamed protein product [Porites evermanni]|uniref:Uncharacterized protein n=1 Tax=Porites evermanni TaxID=104178 RepID=A0ABN8SN26_9CNID|nr:unnamed protein product [Porites evermanni]